MLQPYQLVKDLRNKLENTNPSSILDGNIDQFIEEGIKKKMKIAINYYFSIIIILIITVIIILSTVGIETNKFNKLIIDKRNSQIKI